MEYPNNFLTIPDNSGVDSLAQVGQFFLLGEVQEDATNALGLSIFHWCHKHRNDNPLPTIYLNISSPGGNIKDGLALAATLQRARNEYGFEIVTRVIGQAASMALVLSQFGTHRQVDTFASVMVHDIQAGAVGNTVHLNRKVAYLNNLRRLLANIFAGRNTAGHTNIDYWMEHLDKDEVYLSAHEAVQFGLFDEVVGAFPAPLPVEEQV